MTTARRLLEAADAERRSVERELHDGVQQDLIALSVRLQLARRLARDDTAAAFRLLEEMSGDVQDALGRVRALADRVYPPLLDPLGLAEALRGLGVAVGGEEGGRCDPATEATIYFVCRDLRARRVVLGRDGGRISVAVETDGADAAALDAARDRVEALGGTVEADGSYVSLAIPDAGRSAR
jgi:Histidine kinase